MTEKQILIDVLKLPVKVVAEKANLKPQQIRWIMFKNGVSKGSKAGRPGSNKRYKGFQSNYYFNHY